MFWDFHGVTVLGNSTSPALRKRWAQSFAALPPGYGAPDIVCHLEIVDVVPTVPSGLAQFRQGELLSYHLDGSRAIAHFPRFGQLVLDLARGETEGRIVAAGLHDIAAFEDLLAIALSPHLRRNGLFLLHAFAAVHPDSGRAILLVGEIGAGKTTTGMALLDSGWGLLSNDSPIVSASADVLSYPGLLAAYPDTLTRFESTSQLAADASNAKVIFAAEQVWPQAWMECAPPGAICFPQIEDREKHLIEPLSSINALRHILPHAVEQWDREMMAEHLRVLRELVEAAPAFRLRLGPDVLSLPEQLAQLL